MVSTTQHNDILEEDVIAIMGMTGSGKSTFLNFISGGNRFKVGHDLKSETADIQEFQFPYENDGRKRLLCLLDTPGFGDTYKLDSETLGIIGTGLLDRPNITGIIYFHNINEPRLTHLAHQATEIFYDLCGGEAMKNVILCTSQWDKLMDKTEGERRESQLLSNYWKNMIDDGARTARHNNTKVSAGQILELILGNNPVPVTPKLVTELRVPGVTLEDTSAGRAVSDFNSEKAKQIEREMAALKKSLDAATMRNEKMEAKREEDEKRRAQRESEISAQLKAATEAMTVARNETERLHAERERKDAEGKLEKEREEREAQQKAKEVAEARLNQKAIRAEEERKRLEGEQEKTEKESRNLRQAFDTVEYSKNVGEKVLGPTLGRFIGGCWGYIANAAGAAVDLASEFTGGTRPTDRMQELMTRAGDAVEQGNKTGGVFGATSSLMRAIAQNAGSAMSDIWETKN